MIIIDLFKIILNLIYVPFKYLKKQNKILFLSRQTNTVSLEYRMIIEEILKHKNIKIVTITKKIDKNIISYICNFFLIFKQMYHLGTTKVVITDGYSIPVSILNHNKELIIIQLWHANGIIKKIGLQTLNNRTPFQRKLAIKMNMHKNYTYVISSSKETSKVFKEAFGVSNKQLLNYGTPMLDYIYYNHNNKKEEIMEKYKLDKNKKIIVYLPTYRKEKIHYDTFINNVDYEKYQLVIKRHPVDKENIINKNVTIIKNYIAEDILSIADYVISDYSNVVFEAILSKKRTYCYIYDYDIYEKEFGFNIDLKENFGKYSFENIDELLNQIEKESYDYKYAQKFASKYIENFDGNSTRKIANFIINKYKSL